MIASRIRCSGAVKNRSCIRRYNEDFFMAKSEKQAGIIGFIVKMIWKGQHISLHKDKKICSPCSISEARYFEKTSSG
jgi:hypothetical protein